MNQPKFITQKAIEAKLLQMFGVAEDEGFQIIDANNRGDDFEGGRVLACNAAHFAGRNVAINASQFGANNPHEFLSNYAVRWQDPYLAAIEQARQMLAPDVASNNSRFVEYAVYGFSDAFLSLDNTADDIRGIGADFTTLRNPTKSLVTQRLPNRGLAVEVDEDEELLDPDWQQQKVAWLLGIGDRNRLRRAIALFAAVAAAVAKTWDTTAGKDPDMDLLNELENLSLRPGSLMMGPAAATKRKLSHRAQNTAGGFASAGLSDDEIAQFLSLNEVMTVRPKYATATSTAANIVGSVVMLFTAFRGMSRFDFSNLKTFFAPTNTGQRRAVYVRKIGDKRWRIAVDMGNELVALTAAIGAEVITIS